jgi:hypothetical protein
MRVALLAAILTLAAAPVSQARDLASARSFVLALYAKYHTQAAADFDADLDADTFAPPLLTLIRRDRAQTPEGYVGVLDWDPICDCQDYDIKQLRVKIAILGHGAKAHVHFNNLGQPTNVTLDLARIGDRWRVVDVRTRRTPSLVRLLQASFRKQRR